jgi:hypothetical protein
MPRIRCHYSDCVFLEGSFCGVSHVELDPELGCLTYSSTEPVDEGGLWSDEAELDDWDELDLDEEDEDLWLEDEDEY